MNEELSVLTAQGQRWWLHCLLLVGVNTADRRLEPLLDALNASHTVYRGTDLRLVYEFTA